MPERPPTTPTRAPEYVGPPDDRGRREDVRHYELRPLVVRALDEMLQVRGMVTAMSAGLKLELEDKEHRLQAVERRVITDPPPPFREEETSWHEWDPAAKATLDAVRRRVKDPMDPLNAQQVTQLFMSLRQNIEDREELTTWRRIKRVPGTIAQHWIVGAIGTAAGGGLVALWHWLSGILHR